MGDFEVDEIYLVQLGNSPWAALYVNLWMNHDNWFVRCKHPSEGRFFLSEHGEEQRLKCFLGNSKRQGKVTLFFI